MGKKKQTNQKEEKPKETKILAVLQPPVKFLKKEGNKIIIQDLEGAQRALLLAGNGIFEYFKTAFGTIIRELPKERYPEIKESCDLSIEKLPEEFLYRAHQFFRQVYKKHSSEANIVYFYHPETKEYKEYVPVQEVGGARVKYAIPDEVYKEFHDSGFIEAGTIHSHPDFKASQSSVDHNDEKVFDGWHITIGFVTRDKPEYHCRWMFRGTSFDAEIEDIVEFGRLKVDVPKEWIDKVAKPTPVVMGYGRGLTHQNVNSGWYAGSFHEGYDDVEYNAAYWAAKYPIEDHNKGMQDIFETEETMFFYWGEDMIQEVECTVTSD